MLGFFLRVVFWLGCGFWGSGLILQFARIFFGTVELKRTLIAEDMNVSVALWGLCKALHCMGKHT
jgi:hypothetical protein